MPARDFLEQNLELYKDIAFYRREDERIRAIAEGHKSIRIKKAVVQESHDIYGNIFKTIDRLIYLSEIITEKQTRLDKIQHKTDLILWEINNPTYRELLDLRYIKYNSWDTIADKLQRNDIHSIHRRALWNCERFMYLIPHELMPAIKVYS